MIYTNFIWNYSKLYKDFKNKKEVEKYKRTIINQYTRKKVSDSKEQIILNFIEHNKDICRREMIEKLKKNVNRKKISKVLKSQNIVIEKKSKSFIKIEEKLHHLFTYEIHKVNKKMTYQLLSDYCGVKLFTFKRYISDSKYKIEIEKFNNELNGKKISL